MQGGSSAPTTSDADDGFLASEHIAGLLERLRREPALRAWVLTAPTGALATLGVVLDDNELVQLLASRHWTSARCPSPRSTS